MNKVGYNNPDPRWKGAGVNRLGSFFLIRGAPLPSHQMNSDTWIKHIYSKGVNKDSILNGGVYEAHKLIASHRGLKPPRRQTEQAQCLAAAAAAAPVLLFVKGK